MCVCASVRLSLPPLYALARLLAQLTTIGELPGGPAPSSVLTCSLLSLLPSIGSLPRFLPLAPSLPRSLAPSLPRSLAPSLPPFLSLLLSTFRNQFSALRPPLQQGDGSQAGVCAPQDQPCATRAHTSPAPRPRTRGGPRGTLTACGMATRRTQTSGSRRRPCRQEAGEGRKSDLSHSHK